MSSYPFVKRGTLGTRLLFVPTCVAGPCMPYDGLLCVCLMMDWCVCLTMDWCGYLPCIPVLQTDFSSSNYTPSPVDLSQVKASRLFTHISRRLAQWSHEQWAAQLMEEDEGMSHT